MQTTKEGSNSSGWKSHKPRHTRANTDQSEDLNRCSWDLPCVHVASLRRGQDGHQRSATTRHLRWVISSPPVRRHKTTSHRSKLDTSHVDWSQALPRSDVVLLARRLDNREGHVLRLSFTCVTKERQHSSHFQVSYSSDTFWQRVAGLDLYRQPCPDAFDILQKHSPTHHALWEWSDHHCNLWIRGLTLRQRIKHHNLEKCVLFFWLASTVRWELCASPCQGQRSGFEKARLPRSAHAKTWQLQRMLISALYFLRFLTPSKRTLSPFKLLERSLAPSALRNRQYCYVPKRSRTWTSCHWTCRMPQLQLQLRSTTFHRLSCKNLLRILLRFSGWLLAYTSSPFCFCQNISFKYGTCPPLFHH